MAIYYLHAQIIGRSAGRSAIAAAAYRSASRLVDQQTEKVHDYTKKAKPLYSEMMARDCINPEKDWYGPPKDYDREKFWNQVEQKENRVNSQFARELVTALPCELPLEENIQLAREFCKANFVNRGIVCDLSIHPPDKKGDQRNIHMHVMTATRKMDNYGEWGEKDREANTKDFLLKIRKDWEERVNAALKKQHEQEYGPNYTIVYYKDPDYLDRWFSHERHRKVPNPDIPPCPRVDCRTLQAQREELLRRSHNNKTRNEKLSEEQWEKAEALNRVPQQHMGVVATAIERKGGKPRRGRYPDYVTEKWHELQEKCKFFLDKLKDLRTLSEEKIRGLMEKAKISDRPKLGFDAAAYFPEPKPTVQEKPSVKAGQAPPRPPVQPKKQETREEAIERLKKAYAAKNDEELKESKQFLENDRWLAFTEAALHAKIEEINEAQKRVNEEYSIAHNTRRSQEEQDAKLAEWQRYEKEKARLEKIDRTYSFAQTKNDKFEALKQLGGYDVTDKIRAAATDLLATSPAFESYRRRKAAMAPVEADRQAARQEEARRAAAQRRAEQQQPPPQQHRGRGR